MIGTKSLLNTLTDDMEEISKMLLLLAAFSFTSQQQRQEKKGKKKMGKKRKKQHKRNTLKKIREKKIQWNTKIDKFVTCRFYFVIKRKWLSHYKVTEIRFLLFIPYLNEFECKYFDECINDKCVYFLLNLRLIYPIWWVFYGIILYLLYFS